METLQIKKIFKHWLKNKKFDALFHFAAVVPTSKVSNEYTLNQKRLIILVQDC